MMTGQVGTWQPAGVPKKKRGAATEDAIATLVFERFRVFRERTELSIAPLTLLAGANSSGKSSAMLPLLLLKQTLDAPFDPGAAPPQRRTRRDRVVRRSADARYLRPGRVRARDDTRAIRRGSFRPRHEG